MTLRDLLATDDPRATLLIRVMVGAVFLSEGIQKFLYSDDLGAGRFARIGIPNAEVMGPLVGTIEIVCGALLLLGFLTRIAAVPLIGIMLVAIITTKIPILLGRDLGPFRVRDLDQYGFWSMAHEMRTDWSMLWGSLFLLVVGAGIWSLDARIARRRRDTALAPPRRARISA